MKRAFAVFIGFIVFSILLGSFGTIQAGERGVKTRLGSIVGVLDTGPYFKLPFIENVTELTVRTQTVSYEREEPLAAASKDLQDVKIATVVNYHVQPESVLNIFQQYKTTDEFEARAVRPVVRDVVKAVASQYTAEELVTKRTEFSDKVSALLSEKLEAQSVVVENVNITNFEFSPSFNEAIEKKVTAEQNALAAKNLLEQKKYEAEQAIVTAEAEAKAIKLKSDAANNEKYVALQQLEVQKEFASKWNGVGCQSNCWGVDAQNPIPFLNVSR